jgi:AraC-like DNA-binding protein
MAVKALGSNYFIFSDFPLSVRRVDRFQNISHKDDLTEIEHFHDFTEIAFVIKGKGTQVIEEQEYAVSAGDVFVLQGNQKHYFKDTEGVEIVNVMFNDRKSNPFLSQEVRMLDGYRALFFLESQYRAWHHFKNKLHLNRSEMAKIEMLLNAMLQEFANQDDGYRLVLKNKLEELIVLLSRHYSQLDATEAKALVRIGKVIDFMELHFANKIYLDTLAEMAFMSTRNFQRIFKKAVGSSPSNYLMQIRLQLARRLLRETDFSVAEIGSDSGFGDANYFIKCFKKENGITPVKFRLRYSMQKKG